METKKIYGLLGYNIDYSLSPAMHNAAFERFGISAEYKLFNKKADELDDFLNKDVLGGKISGFNVTIPYKVRIRAMLESNTDLGNLDHWAKVTGALNTVRVEGRKLRGYNTDVPGFKQSLKEDIGYDFRSKKDVFIIGTGGAGRALCIFLAVEKKSSGKIKVYDNDPAQLESLKKVCKKREFERPEVFSEIDFLDRIPEKIKNCDLVINATPLGTKEGDDLPVQPELLDKGMAVYDLVYARETELVKQAREKGLKAVNGLGMLVNQAALAFNIWTGKDLDQTRRVMRKAVTKKIGIT